MFRFKLLFCMSDVAYFVIYEAVTLVIIVNFIYIKVNLKP